MITTSAAYKAAIKANPVITAKVDVYFDGDGEAPATITEIANLSLLEEAKAEDRSPLGRVTANEITIAFDNAGWEFTQSNPNKTYTTGPDIKVEPYLGVTLPNATVEYIPLGVFRTGDWAAPASSLTATVTCHDLLYDLGAMDVPQVPIMVNTTIGLMFQALFDALGLTIGTDYEVDSGLTQAVRVGWIPRGTVLDALQWLAVAGSCSVYADRYGVIQVKSNYQAGVPALAITDTDMIVSADNPQRVLSVYDKAKCFYYLPYIAEAEAVVTVDNIQIPAGGLTLTDLDFSAEPVVDVLQVSLIDAVNSSIESYTYGATGITVVIGNTGAAETVGLSVLGRPVKFHQQSCTAGTGARELAIDNQLIQSATVAQAAADALLAYISDPMAEVSAQYTGDPAIEPLDIVTVTSTADKVPATDVVVIRHQLDYDGGLAGTIEAHRTGE